jgi:hypothetical protein
MSHETDAADAGVAVLRDIWAAQARSAEELESQFAPPKQCKAMRHIGNEPVGEDQRTAWRDRLDREGKLRGDAESVRDLVLGALPDAELPAPAEPRHEHEHPEHEHRHQAHGHGGQRRCGGSGDAERAG